MGELGARLREARESQGLSLGQVEEATHIRIVFLQALEEERFQDLPGDVYGRGLLHNYADYLGIEGTELLVTYRTAAGSSGFHIPQVLDRPLLPRLKSGSGWRRLLAILLLLLLALAGWYAYNVLYLQSAPWPLLTGFLTTTVPVVVPSLPTATQVVVHLAVTPAAPEPTTTRALAETPSETITVSVQGRTVVPTATIGLSATDVLSPTLTAIASEPVTQESGIRVGAVVSATTYLKVLVDGQQVYEGILEPDESRIWTGRQVISLRVGNAAGLVLAVNDVEVPPLGEQGEVVDLEYSVESLPGS